MDGFLCVDKPQGLTSRDVVNRVQRLLRPTKVGHAGTLDPLATGVLVVALGRATRLVQYVQRLPKHYVGSFLLGQTSDTEDISGNVTIQPVEKCPTRAEAQQVCQQFVGEISQIPPAFSALKVQGQRAYKLARRGKHVELAARTVTIHRIELVRFEYPLLELSVVCGGGTYLRSLGRDIGAALGCGAVMSALRRTAIGCFSVDVACQLDALTGAESVAKHRMPTLAAVEDLPRVCLLPTQQRALTYGQQIMLPPTHDRDKYAATSVDNELLAILGRTADGRYRPAINFSARQ